MLQHADSILMALIVFNISISAAQKVLELIKDKTSSEADNKAHAFIGKYLGYVQKLIDWISANRKH